MKGFSEKMCNKLGILMLDTKFPRIIGDVGNEKSFSFPVEKKIIKGADPKAVVVNADKNLLKPFIEAAKELESMGVSAITTSCGFLAMFQKELADAVGIPVFTSALLWLPTVSAMLPKGKIVGVLTADSTKLSQKHFDGVGINNTNKVIYGMEGTQFSKVFVGNSETLDSKLAEKEMLKKADEMVKAHPEVGAIVFECTNMPPYAKAVEELTGRKVFHIINLSEAVMFTL